MMMPRQGYSPVRLGGLLGAVSLGALWLVLAPQLPADLGMPEYALPYYYLFSFLAIGSAVRVITHTKPVYAALWFVMVVLATAGLFLLLSATFMALAMVIIYGGAILVTYVFVIMLAAQSGDAQAPDSPSSYDRVSREPFAAVAAGFLLLAVLLSVAFGDHSPNPSASAEAMGQGDAQILQTELTRRPDRVLAQQLGEASVPQAIAGPQRLTNVERVGMDLFKSHPLGLELAGIILLVSLIGAVVIARKRVEGPTTERASG
jgi:NADH-quinone oxidoreductase subunit J